ncbi:2-amino-4-hydroxy-6-hydroxymethyldihydropteridine diphosphokinase [Oxalobacteraceae bacterium GrIS 2.11]
MQPGEHIAYIGLGANLDDPEKSIQMAISELDALPLSIINRKSSLYQTAPLDAGGDDYINAVVELHTRLTPPELLNSLQQIESRHGRVRSYQNAPRILDCDILLYDDETIHSPTLIIPHPRMHERAFVLVPLIEIAPEIHIPDRGTAQTLLIGVQDQAIQKLSKSI